MSEETLGQTDLSGNVPTTPPVPMPPVPMPPAPVLPVPVPPVPVPPAPVPPVPVPPVSVPPVPGPSPSPALAPATTPTAPPPVPVPPAAPVSPPPPPPPPPAGMTELQKIWPYVGMAMLALVFVALAWFLYSYAAGVGYAKLGTIEGTRPLLVVAAIMSTIAFGGALLFGSLFSSEGTFEERFRHAREIFLVFSGVFGTVLGFYFGAGEGKNASMAVSATRQETTVVAYVSGGTPPYKITAT